MSSGHNSQQQKKEDVFVKSRRLIEESRELLYTSSELQQEIEAKLKKLKELLKEKDKHGKTDKDEN